MPFLNIELIKYIKNNCQGFDVTVGKLVAVIRLCMLFIPKIASSILKKQLKDDGLKINAFLKYVKTQEISVHTLRKFDKKTAEVFQCK